MASPTDIDLTSGSIDERIEALKAKYEKLAQEQEAAANAKEEELAKQIEEYRANLVDAIGIARQEAEAYKSSDIVSGLTPTPLSTVEDLTRLGGRPAPKAKPDYDYESAADAMEETGALLYDKESKHFSSRVPRGQNEGMLLKAPGHETYEEMVRGENEAGYQIVRKGNREFSVKVSDEAIEPQEINPETGSVTGLTKEEWDQPFKSWEHDRDSQRRRNIPREDRNLDPFDPDVTPADFSSDWYFPNDETFEERMRAYEDARATTAKEFAEKTGFWNRLGQGFKSAQMSVASDVVKDDKFRGLYLYFNDAFGSDSDKEALEKLDLLAAETSGYVSGILSEQKPEGWWEETGLMVGGSLPATLVGIGSAVALPGMPLTAFVAGGLGGGFLYGAASGDAEIDLIELEQNLLLQSEGNFMPYKISDEVRNRISRQYGVAESISEGVGNVFSFGLGKWVAAPLFKTGVKEPLKSATKAALTQKFKLAAKRIPLAVGADLSGEAVSEIGAEYFQTAAIKELDPEREADLIDAGIKGATLGIFLGGPGMAVGAASSKLSQVDFERAIRGKGIWKEATYDPIKALKEHAPELAASIEKMSDVERQEAIAKWQSEYAATQYKYHSLIVDARTAKSNGDDKGADILTAKAAEVKLQLNNLEIQLSLASDMAVEIRSETEGGVEIEQKSYTYDVALKNKGVDEDLTPAGNRNEAQSSAEKALNALGLQVVWYESSENNPDGFYDPLTPGIIYLEADGDASSTYLVATGMHEATHFIQFTNPDVYAELKDIVGDAEILFSAAEYALRGAKDGTLTGKDAILVQFAQHIQQGGTTENFVFTDAAGKEVELTNEQKKDVLIWAELEGMAVAVEKGVAMTQSSFMRTVSRLGLGGRNARAAVALYDALVKSKADTASLAMSSTFVKGKTVKVKKGTPAYERVKRQRIEGVKKGKSLDSRREQLGLPDSRPEFDEQLAKDYFELTDYAQDQEDLDVLVNDARTYVLENEFTTKEALATVTYYQEIDEHGPSIFMPYAEGPEDFSSMLERLEGINPTEFFDVVEELFADRGFSLGDEITQAMRSRLDALDSRKDTGERGKKDSRYKKVLSNVDTEDIRSQFTQEELSGGVELPYKPGKIAKSTKGRSYNKLSDEAPSTVAYPEFTQADIDLAVKNTQKAMGDSRFNRALDLSNADSLNLNASFLNDSLNMPSSVRFWYETLGNDFRNRFRGATEEDAVLFANLISATSPRTKVPDNLRQAVSVFIDYKLGVPSAVAIGQSKMVGIQKAFEGKVDEGSRFKTGSFADTFLLTMGLESKVPMSTNDVIMAGIYGMKAESYSNPLVYEMVSRFHVELASMVNKSMSNVDKRGMSDSEKDLVTTPWTPWQLQAVLWSNRQDNTGTFSDELELVFEEWKDAGLPVKESSDGTLYVNIKDLTAEMDVSGVTQIASKMRRTPRFAPTVPLLNKQVVKLSSPMALALSRDIPLATRRQVLKVVDTLRSAQQSYLQTIMSKQTYPTNKNILRELFGLEMVETGPKRNTTQSHYVFDKSLAIIANKTFNATASVKEILAGDVMGISRYGKSAKREDAIHGMFSTNGGIIQPTTTMFLGNLSKEEQNDVLVYAASMIGLDNAQLVHEVPVGQGTASIELFFPTQELRLSDISVIAEEAGKHNLNIQSKPLATGTSITIIPTSSDGITDSAITTIHRALGELKLKPLIKDQDLQITNVSNANEKAKSLRNKKVKEDAKKSSKWYAQDLTQKGRDVVDKIAPTKPKREQLLRTPSKFVSEIRKLSEAEQGRLALSLAKSTGWQLYNYAQINEDNKATAAAVMSNRLSKVEDMKIEGMPSSKWAQTNVLESRKLNRDEYKVRDVDLVLDGNLFSKIVPVLKEATQKKMTAKELLKYLEKNAVSKEEVFWSGLQEFLNNQGDGAFEVDLAINAVQNVRVAERNIPPSEHEYMNPRTGAASVSPKYLNYPAKPTSDIGHLQWVMQWVKEGAYNPQTGAGHFERSHFRSQGANQLAHGRDFVIPHPLNPQETAYAIWEWQSDWAKIIGREGPVKFSETQSYEDAFREYAEHVSDYNNWLKDLSDTELKEIVDFGLASKTLGGSLDFINYNTILLEKVSFLPGLPNIGPITLGQSVQPLNSVTPAGWVEPWKHKSPAWSDYLLVEQTLHHILSNLNYRPDDLMSQSHINYFDAIKEYYNHAIKPENIDKVVDAIEASAFEHMALYGTWNDLPILNAFSQEHRVNVVPGKAFSTEVRDALKSFLQNPNLIPRTPYIKRQEEMSFDTLMNRIQTKPRAETTSLRKKFVHDRGRNNWELLTINQGEIENGMRYMTAFGPLTEDASNLKLISSLTDSEVQEDNYVNVGTGVLSILAGFKSRISNTKTDPNRLAWVFYRTLIEAKDADADYESVTLEQLAESQTRSRQGEAYESLLARLQTEPQFYQERIDSVLAELQNQIDEHPQLDEAIANGEVTAVTPNYESLANDLRLHFENLDPSMWRSISPTDEELLEFANILFNWETYYFNELLDPVYTPTGHTTDVPYAAAEFFNATFDNQGDAELYKKLVGIQEELASYYPVASTNYTINLGEARNNTTENVEMTSVYDPETQLYVTPIGEFVQIPTEEEVQQWYDTTEYELRQSQDITDILSVSDLLFSAEGAPPLTLQDLLSFKGLEISLGGGNLLLTDGKGRVSADKNDTSNLIVQSFPSELPSNIYVIKPFNAPFTKNPYALFSSAHDMMMARLDDADRARLVYGAKPDVADFSNVDSEESDIAEKETGLTLAEKLLVAQIGLAHATDKSSTLYKDYKAAQEQPLDYLAALIKETVNMVDDEASSSVNAYDPDDYDAPLTVWEEVQEGLHPNMELDNFNVTNERGMNLDANVTYQILPIIEEMVNTAAGWQTNVAVYEPRREHFSTQGLVGGPFVTKPTGKQSDEWIGLVAKQRLIHAINNDQTMLLFPDTELMNQYQNIGNSSVYKTIEKVYTNIAKKLDPSVLVDGKIPKIRMDSPSLTLEVVDVSDSMTEMTLSDVLEKSVLSVLMLTDAFELRDTVNKLLKEGKALSSLTLPRDDVNVFRNTLKSLQLENYSQEEMLQAWWTMFDNAADVVDTSYEDADMVSKEGLREVRKAIKKLLKKQGNRDVLDDSVISFFGDAWRNPAQQQWLSNADPSQYELEEGDRDNLNITSAILDKALRRHNWSDFVKQEIMNTWSLRKLSYQWGELNLAEHGDDPFSFDDVQRYLRDVAEAMADLMHPLDKLDYVLKSNLNELYLTNNVLQYISALAPNPSDLQNTKVSVSSLVDYNYTDEGITRSGMLLQQSGYNIFKTLSKNKPEGLHALIVNPRPHIDINDGMAVEHWNEEIFGQFERDVTDTHRVGVNEMNRHFRILREAFGDFETHSLGDINSIAAKAEAANESLHSSENKQFMLGLTITQKMIDGMTKGVPLWNKNALESRKSVVQDMQELQVKLMIVGDTAYEQEKEEGGTPGYAQAAQAVRVITGILENFPHDDFLLNNSVGAYRAYFEEVLIPHFKDVVMAYGDLAFELEQTKRELGGTKIQGPTGEQTVIPDQPTDDIKPTNYDLVTDLLDELLPGGNKMTVSESLLRLAKAVHQLGENLYLQDFTRAEGIFDALTDSWNESYLFSGVDTNLPDTKAVFEKLLDSIINEPIEAEVLLEDISTALILSADHGLENIENIKIVVERPDGRLNNWWVDVYNADYVEGEPVASYGPYDNEMMATRARQKLVLHKATNSLRNSIKKNETNNKVWSGYGLLTAFVESEHTMHGMLRGEGLSFHKGFKDVNRKVWGALQSYADTPINDVMKRSSSAEWLTSQMINPIMAAWGSPFTPEAFKDTSYAEVSEADADYYFSVQDRSEGQDALYGGAFSNMPGPNYASKHNPRVYVDDLSHPQKIAMLRWGGFPLKGTGAKPESEVMPSIEEAQTPVVTKRAFTNTVRKKKGWGTRGKVPLAAIQEAVGNRSDEGLQESISKLIHKTVVGNGDRYDLTKGNKCLYILKYKDPLKGMHKDEIIGFAVRQRPNNTKSNAKIYFTSPTGNKVVKTLEGLDLNNPGSKNGVDAWIANETKSFMFPLIREAAKKRTLAEIFEEDMNTLESRKRTDGSKRKIAVTKTQEYLLELLVESDAYVMPSISVFDKQEFAIRESYDYFGDIALVWDPQVVKDELGNNFYDRDMFSPRIPDDWHSRHWTESANSEALLKEMIRQADVDAEGRPLLRGAEAPYNYPMASADFYALTSVFSNRIYDMQQLEDVVAKQTEPDSMGLPRDWSRHEPIQRVNGLIGLYLENDPMQKDRWVNTERADIYRLLDERNLREKHAEGILDSIVKWGLSNEPPRGVSVFDHLNTPSVRESFVETVGEEGFDTAPLYEILDVLAKESARPQPYTEAKPIKAFPFGEGGLMAAVVPYETSPDLIKKLESKGVLVRQYQKGDDISLRFALDELEDSVLFSRKELPANQSVIENSKLVSYFGVSDQEGLVRFPTDRPYTRMLGVLDSRKPSNRELQEAKREARELEKARGRERLAKLREQLENRIERLKLAAANREEVREQAIKLVNALPQRLRGRLATRLARAKTLHRLQEIAELVVRIASENEYRESVRAMRKQAKRLRKMKMSHDTRTKELEPLLNVAETTAYQPGTKRMFKQNVLSVTDLVTKARVIAEAMNEAKSLVKLAKEDWRTARGERAERLASTSSKIILALSKMKPRPGDEFKDRPSRIGSTWFGSKQTLTLISDLMSKAESPDDVNEVAEVLHHALCDAESAAMLGLKETFTLLENLAKDAGYKDLDNLVDATGISGISVSTEVFNVVLGGSEIEITLDQLMKLYAFDQETIDRVVDEVNSMGEVVREGVGLKLHDGRMAESIKGVTREEVSRALSKLPASLRNFIDSAKEYRETVLRPQAFASFYYIHGYEPKFVEGYEPRSRQVSVQTKEMNLELSAMTKNFLDMAGFTKERTEGGGEVILGGFVEDFINNADASLKLTHMAIPVRDAVAIIEHPDVREAINKHLGAEFQKALSNRIMHGSGMTRRITKGGLGETVSGSLGSAYLTLNPGTYGRVLFGGLANLTIELPISQVLIGMLSLQDMQTIIEEAHQNGYLWARANSGAMRRQLQSEEQRGTKIADKDKFVKSMEQMLKTLALISKATSEGNMAETMRLGKEAWRILQSAPDNVHALQYFDNIVATVAYVACKSKLERMGVSGRKLIEMAGKETERVIRTTQNTSSALDATVTDANDASTGTRTRLWFPFSSDPATTGNTIWRAIRYGNAKQKARKLSGAINSVVIGGAGWSLGWGTMMSLVARMFADDEPDVEGSIEEQMQYFVEEAQKISTEEAAKWKLLEESLSKLGYPGIAISWLLSIGRGYEVGLPQLWADPTEDSFRQIARLYSETEKEEVDPDVIFDALQRLTETGRQVVGDPTVAPQRLGRKISGLANPQLEETEKAVRKIRRLRELTEEETWAWETIRDYYKSIEED